jgi:hypothetical protein
MEDNNKDEIKEVFQRLYDQTVYQILEQGKTTSQIKKDLLEKGMNEKVATEFLKKVKDDIYEAKRSSSNKDMIYGALWCIGGLVATFAELGYIFWGAIIFGAIQFFRGVADSPGEDDY